MFGYTDNINSKYVLELLDSVTALNKPVIVALARKEFYSGWSAALTKDGNAEETKILCEFAIKHNVKGYSLWYLAPNDVCIHCLLIKQLS